MDVQVIDNHQIVNVPIFTADTIIRTHNDKAILSINQYAHIKNSKTVHLCGQTEVFKKEVNEKLFEIPGGLQRIMTNNDFFILLDMKSGLPYMPL